MSSLTVNPALDRQTPAAAHTRRRRSRLSLALSLLMTVIVVVGFWSSFFGPLTHGLANRHWVLNLHGAIYTGWMLLLLVQVTLAAQGRVSAHRTLGNFGIGYGWLVLAMGLIVSIAAPVLHVHAGEWDLDTAARFLLTPLGDMVLFGGFFATAVRLRRQPEIHKRLMLLATVALLFAAVSRMGAFVPSRSVQLLIWLSPVLAASTYEIVTRRTVHPAYRWGLLILLIAPLRQLVAQTDSWLPVGRTILGAFL